jgi:membrane associated rhomboid family serine protease
MPRYAPSGVSYQFGPGPMTPAVRAIIYANIAVFLVTSFAPDATLRLVFGLLGLTPQAVVERGWIWQLATYLFVHGGLMHILFNMLAVWMFGVELERRWGSRAFTTYYFVTGVGAGVTVVLVSLLPFAATRATYVVPTIGASGAVYGLLMAWAILFPDRVLMLMMMFPVPARVYALLMGAIAFYSALGASGSNVSNFAHLGGLAVGYLYLKGPKGPRDFKLELQYRMTKWRMERMRRKFDVHRGGRVH